jgi:3-hydroxyisobutyrate dehydrogenase-like beta-hydroxyacid dehydrogenase
MLAAAFATIAPAAGYIGLDQMGRAMARRLAGRRLAVRSGSPGRAVPLAQSAGRTVTVAAAAADRLGRVAAKRLAWVAPA